MVIYRKGDLLELVFDRTQKDVDRAVEIIRQVKTLGIDNVSDDIKELHNNGLKGCYNLSDIRRIYAVISNLLINLNENGYSPATELKTYLDNDIFDESDIKIYLDNIKNLRNGIAVFSSTPQTPNINEWINFNVANDIEKILFDITEILELVELSRIHCGTISSSNNIILPQNPLETKLRSNTFKWLDRKNITWEKFDSLTLNWLEFEFKDW